MNHEKQRKTNRILWLASLASVLAAGLISFSMPDDQNLRPAGSGEETVLAEGAQLLQTLHYTRCGHSVVRRTSAPAELQGMNLAQAGAMYPDWQVTEFAPALMKMERRMDLFCPDHLVLMPDGAGFLCVFENRYGDAMALVRELELPVSGLPAAVQEEVEMGVGFSTAEELEMWLEGVES